MRRTVIKFSVGIFILAVFSIVASLAISQVDKKKKNELYREVALFSDSLAIIQSDYVDEVSTKDLIYGALKGMVSSLDPHSQFMDPDTYNELKVDTEGKFGGLGLEITIKDGLLTVMTPIEDTPAWKAGIKAGDRIVKINDELTRDITLTDAVKKLRGEPGSTVNITVLREKEKKLLDFKLTRDLIKIKDIKEAKILEEGIGYIRLVEFREDTTRDMGMVLDGLKKQAAKGIILDLRNNPGGLLDIAVSVTEKFVEKGKLIVSTKGRKENQDMEFIARKDGAYLDIPLVILVNDGSASGSEIVAGCLQDYKRAIILGTQTFGKGSVQTVIPLSDGSALKLTTSRYFTPLGRAIHGKGITPDIVVEQPETETLLKEAPKESPQDIFESLESKQPEETKERQEGKGQQEEKKEAKDYKKDYQLMQAVDVLKALNIYKDFNRSK
jgi:carboxyl-terminal processing protease